MYKIYIPRVQGMLPKHLEDRGIADLAEDQGPQWESVTEEKSPDGSRGMVISWLQGNPKADPPPGVPERYQWTAAPPNEELGLEKGSWYFGYDPDLKPGPRNFQRIKVRPGGQATLRDGRKWQIPSANLIPEVYGIDLETGEKRGRVEARFERYCEMCAVHAQEFFEHQEDIGLMARMFAGVKVSEEEKTRVLELCMQSLGGKTRLASMDPKDLQMSIPLDDALDHAWNALAINYRVNPVICSILELLDNDAVVQICMTAIDVPQIVQHLKKNDSARAISLPNMSVT